MQTSSLRKAFLNYFAARGHRIVASSPVIGPADDPTVMWTNAGMVQFKDVFVGKERRDYTRAATSQKCLRAGGKHNDLENVGFTARHHTFFEMLGNFSFGDYFKADAIRFAWEFVTGPMEQGNLGLDPERLWVTVFEGYTGIPADDEAAELWRKAGVPEDRILRFGKKDNFWQMGDTGPCGPCSEMHYYRPKDLAGNRAELVNGEGDDIMEIWNLVFMQYEQDGKGGLTPLPKPSIDTGMGLERVASILQGVESNYEIDLFKPIFEGIWAVAKVPVPERTEHTNRTASQVVADHIRAATFMVFDGIVPSNEGRGYVLRKIIRRALRFGKKLGIEGPFFAGLAPAVLHAMQDAYPELRPELTRIQKVIRREESQFSLTLTLGLKQLEACDLSSGTLAGAEIFKLYDTFGFPVDLVEDWCKERDLACDLEGFQKELGEQKAKGRAAMKTHDVRLQGDLAILAELPPTRFLGYEEEVAEDAKVVALFDADHRRVETLREHGYVVLDKTPFYAESGGQVGDHGMLRWRSEADAAYGCTCAVTDCRALAPKRHVHFVKDLTHELMMGTIVRAEIDAPRRARIRAHHTATHLLHAALREVLGTHVKQAGSVVDEQRLRFDFTHFAPIEPEQLLEIERRANEQVLLAKGITLEEMPIDKALSSGAMALFGEKYGETVRVLTVPDFSTELCGGTHVNNTGRIGTIKIVSEGAVASGVRRLEAVAGMAALERLQDDEKLISDLAHQANAGRDALPTLISAKDTRIQQLERELKETKLKAASDQMKQIEEFNQQKAEFLSAYQSGNQQALLDALMKPSQAVLTGPAWMQYMKIGDMPLNISKSTGLSPDVLREHKDQMRTQSKEPSVIVLFSEQASDKVSVLVSVSPELTNRVDAGLLFKSMAVAINGKGGGRKDMAQGGGDRPGGIPDAFNLLITALKAAATR